MFFSRMQKICRNAETLQQGYPDRNEEIAGDVTLPPVLRRRTRHFMFKCRKHYFHP